MDFKDITNMVMQNYDLPEKSTLTDQYAYHILKCLNFEYKNKLISRENAGRRKRELIREYEERKKYDEIREENFRRQIENIRLSEQVRVRINHAVNNGEMSKQLFLDAVKCIGLMCGTLSQFKTCEKLLEGIEYEEQERMPV